MALFDNPLANLAVGLASLRNPGLIGQIQQQRQRQAEMARQAEEDKRRREREDFLFQQQKRQAQAQSALGGFLGAPDMAGSQSYGMSNAEKLQAAIPLLAQADPQAAMGLMKPEKDSYTLSPGQVRFSNGIPIAYGGEDPKKLEEERKRIFDQETKLRGEYSKETKEFTDINNAFGRIVASATDPSPAGDMALIFNYMKMLDPGSTVREGEYATARNAGSVPQTVMALYNRIIDGTSLEEKQRFDFTKRAKALYDKSAELNKKRADEFGKLAKRKGLNPENVIINRNLFKSFSPASPSDIFTGQFHNGLPVYARPDGTKYAIEE